MMKVVFLTRNYPPTICGVGDHTYHLATEMLSKGIKTHVICSADQIVQSNDINVYPIVKEWNTEGVGLVVDVLKKIQPHWLIVQYVPHAYHPKGLPFALLSLYRAVSQLNVSILTVFHEVKIRPERAIKTRLISFLQGQLAYKLSNRSSKVVTSIDFYDNNLKKLSADKKTIIPIASNILPIEVSLDVKQNLKEKYKISPDAKVICTFGDRNVSDYVPAFDRLLEDYPNLVWLICGKNKTPSVIWRSRSYFRYVGAMPTEQIYQHLSLGDVFFMPDFVSEEGQGGTCNKSGSLACAMSLGIPIVGSKGDMNNKLLIDGYNILLTDIRNPLAVYDALKLCLETQGLSASLGHNARQFYEQSLTWTASAEHFLALMDPSVKRVKIPQKQVLLKDL